MTTPPPLPASPDDEIERRLSALKSGADPASFGPPRAPRPRPDPSGRAAPGPDAGPAIVGEVLEDGRSWAPGGDRAGGPGASRSGAAGPRAPGERRGSGGAASPRGPAIRAVSWGFGQAQAGRLGLWIGLALVAFGGYLVLAEFVPGISVIGSLALTVLGGALVAWHLAGRAGAWAVHVGVVLAGFGAARLVAEVAGLPSAGWGTLGAGLGLLLVAVVRVTRGEGLRWQAWVGAALAIFGGWGVLGATVPGFPTLGDLIVPVVLVLMGVAVLRRGFRGT